MDEAIVAYVRRRYNVLIGERTAEQIKLSIGCAAPPPERMSLVVKGRDLSSGTPRQIELTGEDTAEALQDAVAQIVEAVRSTLERTPPELGADIIDQGIVLAGGGALLRHLDDVLREATGLPVVLAEDPLRCVVMGAGECLERPELLKRVAL
jgi:rod shape-determining protein MreB